MDISTIRQGTLTAPLIAAIDVGTNSFHMVIASVDQRGMLTIKNREKVMVRLGSSSGDMKVMPPDAIARGVETLKMFAGIAKAEGASIRAVATSATREANNQKEFLDKVKKETGIEVEVVSGAEEGRLIYLGVQHGLPIDTQKALIIDIGGGSTETIIGHHGEIKYIYSAKLGAIRLTKQFFPDGVSSPERINACREFIKGNWSPIMKRVLETGFENVIGTAGTIHNLAAMALAMRNQPLPEIFNGLTVYRDDMLYVIKKVLETESSQEREQLPGMDAKRADIILAGALIIEYAIIQLNIQKILLSSYALREGILYDTVFKNKALKEHHNLSLLRYETVYSLCHKFNVDLKHAEHVKEIAISIFDQMQNLHNYTYFERELLESASLLHDIGYHISHDQHHKHSYYIICNSIMPGFSSSEAELIGNIARYHRKSHPKKKHENFARLTLDRQKMVKLLAGILRIAEGIDRRQLGVVGTVEVKCSKSSVDITLIPASKEIEPDIELWGAIRRKPLLEEALKRIVNLKLKD